MRWLVPTKPRNRQNSPTKPTTPKAEPQPTAQPLTSLDLETFARQTLSFNPDPVQSRILQANPKRCLLNCSRQWGKSTITAVKAVHNAFTVPGSLTLILSPSERQSAEFVRKASQFAAMAGAKPRGDGRNGVSLLFPNQSRIIGLPSSEHTIRGFSAVSLLLIDEASRVADELYQSVRPMLAASNGSLWLISTPNGRRGFFYQAWSSVDSDWHRFSVPATECPRIAPDFLETERHALSERLFRQEYLCEFNDTDSQLLPRDIIESALTNDVPPMLIPPTPPPQPATPCSLPDVFLRKRTYVGIDFGKSRDHTAIVVLERSQWITGEINRYDYSRAKEDRLLITHIERLPLGTEYTTVLKRLTTISRSIPAEEQCSLIADATGVGDPIVEQIRALRLQRSLYPVKITAGSASNYSAPFHNVPKNELLTRLTNVFERRQIRIPSTLPLARTLIEELASLSVKISSAGNEIIAPWRASQHDDIVFALALIIWRTETERWS